MSAHIRWVLGTALVTAVSSAASCQTLERQVMAHSSDVVEFHVPARAGVCGDGRYWIRTDSDSWYGTMNDVSRTAPCEAGPVRVLVHKADGEVLRLETRVGPRSDSAGIANLGRVSPGEALTFLGGLARRAEGRPARDALLPLGIADSMDAGSVLREVATSASRSREVRRSAISWLIRRESPTVAAATLSLVARIARDQDEHTSLRQAVVGQLGRTEGGIPVLIEMTRSESDGWLGRQAAEVLARSGDPRARRVVRELVVSDRASAEVRAAALAGMGSEHGTLQDAQAVMRAWPSMTSDKLKDAALSVVAGVGGPEGRTFLLKVVKDESAVSRTRRRAASLLDRAGVPVKEVIGTYDAVSDGELRNQLIDVLANAGTREATAKLVSIAKDATQLAARRRAISALGRTDDPTVRSALQGIVTR